MKYNKPVLPSFPKKIVRIELTSHASKAGGCCSKKTVGRWTKQKRNSNTAGF